MSKTAIIGLGNMGRGMAQSILKAGIALTGYDLCKDARSRFAADGGTPVETARDAAQGCDVLIVMVQNAAQVRDILIDSGAMDVLAPGAVVILSATVAPSDARALGQDLAAAGHMLLDAPVSGGTVGADSGTLTIMASGPPEAFDRAGPVLDAMAETVHRLGDAPGIGATYKVVHQLAAGVHLVAAAELLSFGANAGCDPKTLFEIVSASAGNSWMLGNRGPRMMQQDPEVTSSVDIFVKDLGLVVKAAGESSASVPLAEAALAMMQEAHGMGLGRKDDSLVVRAYEARSGKAAVDS
jgi:3-hydroxyisobutyrate dehydrogenase